MILGEMPQMLELGLGRKLNLHYWKSHDWNLTDKVAWMENAELENDRLEFAPSN